jgi:periplasmic protein TonB
MVHRSNVELKLDEIIFEEKNKAYGAYNIRSAYNSHLKNAVIIAFFSASAVFIPFAYNLWNKPHVAWEPDTHTLPDPEIFEIEPQKYNNMQSGGPQVTPQNTPDPSTQTSFIPTSTPDNPIENTIRPDEGTAEGVEGSSETSGTTEGSGGPESGLNGNGHDQISAESSEPVNYASSQPEFDAFEKLIKKHLRYPREAIHNEITGIVYVEFIIEKDGSVNHVKIVKGIGYGCDEEAERVIRLTSKKWKAGRHNDKPVRFKKVLPIHFVIK